MNISDEIYSVGVQDFGIRLFEGQYPLTDGATYNSYLIKDEKTALLDTVEEAFGEVWLDNLKRALDGRDLDYLVIHHMEPDHSANIALLLRNYPSVKIVGNAKTFPVFEQFFPEEKPCRIITVKDGDSLGLGKHKLTFIMAPMVHWPEVMVSYESAEKVLFSADAFGKFGSSLKNSDWVDEARRYYINIVGKYGASASALLKKAATLDIEKICPLHGPVLGGDLSLYIEKYLKWSSYTPEEKGTLIVYASVYGNTKKAAYILRDELEAKGEKTEIYELNTCDISEAVAKAYKYDKLVCCSVSYDASVLPCMAYFLMRLKSKMYQNRKVGLIENTSFAPSALRTMKAEFEQMKNITFSEPFVSIKSSVKKSDEEEIKKLAEALLAE